MDEKKRLLLALALSALILLTFDALYRAPMKKRMVAQAEAEMAANPAPAAQTPNAQTTTPTTAPEFQERSALITKSQRINIDTPNLIGSFQTTGSMFDDLRLKNYQQTLKDDSETVIVFSPKGAKHAAYAFDNWTTSLGQNGLDTAWSVVSGSTLTPTSNVVLQHVSDKFTVRRIISIDDQFLITLDDTVTNTTSGEIALVRSGAARQHGLPDDLTNFFILQEGPIMVTNGHMKDMKYKGLAKKKKYSEEGISGWVGLTDRYWLIAAIAPQGKTMTANFEFKNINGADVYETNYVLEPTTLSAGATIQSKGYIYAGAKSKTALAAYTEEEGISRLDLAIDYGLLGMLTKPMSWALTKLGKLTGNFGLGIILLTLILKLVLYPLNNKSYSSMAKMKLLQPKIKKMQERYGDDRMKLQQEMMALYRKEGASPVAGCLPMIPQMFIFFALYKSLFITFEMRHAPFFGWLKDLSAKDPLSILNGFGALPWDPVPIAAMGFLALGPLALLYGITMALMQTLNTPPADKTQARIFQLMPLFFMFILAPFAAGLLLYWVWNNILTIIQQYIITRKYKVETPLDRFFGKIMGKTAKSAND